MIDITALRGILVACLMKLCQKVVETQFVVLNPAAFYLTNGTAVENGQVRNGTCYFDFSDQTAATQSSATSWIYTSRYLLPVLGGVVSSVWLGYARVLQIGGAIMLLATVLMSTSVYLGLMCEPSPIIPITWLLLPLFFGLTQSNIVHGMFQWHTRPKFHTLVSSIYYFNAVIGEWIALLIAPLSEASKFGSHATLIFIALSILFIALSQLLPGDSSPEPFEMPTRARMTRYFQIFSGLILFLITVADTRPAVYMTEIRYFMNGTDYYQENSWLSAKWLNLIAMMCSCFLSTCISLVCAHQLPVQPRMQLGILLESAVSAGLLIFTAVGTGTSNSDAVVVVYTAASIVDAVAEVLVMVAAYDLVQQVAPSSSKIFVYSIMFTVWGLANFASRFAVIVLENQLLHVQNERPMFYIYHVITLVVLITCSIYHRFLALPLALQLTPADGDNSGIEDELQPLLNQAESC